ncbi:MAG: alpha-E domain-containing protein [Actinomycetota bacterium]
MDSEFNQIKKPPATLVSAVYGAAGTASTILGSLSAARQNARSVRDMLPSDFYEAINKLHASNDTIDYYSPGKGIRQVLERLAVAHGIYEWLAPHDEAAAFYRLGRSLERMDLVSRLLNMHIETEWPEQGPATTLRAVGGLSTFLRYRIPMTPKNLRQFLVTDMTFPRSLLQSSTNSEAAIRDIGRMSSLNVDQVIRPIGLLKSRLMYLGDIPHEIEDVLQQTIMSVAMTSVGVKDQFFRPLGSIVWSN